jgi:hypothetical protein
VHISAVEYEMKRKLSSLLISVIFIVLLAGSFQSTADTIKLYGTITDKETGAVIPQATISFTLGFSGTTQTTTDTDGNYELFLEISPTSVGTSNLPESFLLNQNYPNPFNPTTIIEYQIPKAEKVQLAIFNIMGQKICQLIDGYQNEGFHKIKWNGTDDSGKRVSAGVYLYQLKMGNQTAIRRMLMLDGGITGYSGPKVGRISLQSEKTVAANSNTNYMIVRKEWYTSKTQIIELQGDEKEIRKDFALSSVNFLPLDTRNHWEYRKLDIETQTSLSTTRITVSDTLIIDGRKYFHIVQSWNNLLPDTLTVREEGFLMYWYLGGKDCLICDFKAPIDSSWTILLPAHGNNEAQTIIIQKVQLENYPLHQYQYLKFSIIGKDIYWYEKYSADEGIFLIHGVNINPDMTETYVLETFYSFLKGGGVNIDYDYPSLFRHLNALFGK